MAGHMCFGGNGSGDQPYHFEPSQSLNFNVDNIHSIEHELMMQRQIESQLLSPTESRRHDSLFSHSPSNGSISGGPSPHQAGAQPCVLASQMTTPQGHPQRPVKMSRTESQLSTASGQQQRRSQHRTSFGNESRSGVDMSRSSTQHSVKSSGYTQHIGSTTPQTRILQPHVEFTAYTSSNMGYSNSVISTMGIPNTCNANTANETNSVNGFGLEGIQSAPMAEGSDMSRIFSPVRASIIREKDRQTFTSNENTYFSKITLSRPPIQNECFDRQLPYGGITPTYSSLSVDTAVPSYIPVVSSVNSSLSYQPPSPPRLAPKRRRRRSDVSANDMSDPVIGHLTTSGKFKCPDPDCSNVSFGRQADLRRHYDHVHADRRFEFFCTFDGCARSKKPTGKAKGRSFGTREDKMREHMRTVHEKAGKKRNDGLGTTIDRGEAEGEEFYSDEEYALENRPSKKIGSFKVHENPEV